MEKCSVTARVHHRDTCRLCGSPSVSLVVALRPIPVSENYGTDSETARNAPRFPVDVYMCAACGHVQQLVHTKPQTQILGGGHTHGAISLKGFSAFKC